MATLAKTPLRFKRSMSRLSVALVFIVAACGSPDGASGPGTATTADGPPFVLAKPTWQLRQVRCPSQVSCWEMKLVAPDGCTFGLGAEIVVRHRQGQTWLLGDYVNREVPPDRTIRLEFVVGRDRGDDAVYPRSDFTARVTRVRCY